MMKNLPRDIVPPAPRGPRVRRPGAGTHAQGVRRQRSRGDARRAALREAVR